jgi:hypothetical protein
MFDLNFVYRDFVISQFFYTGVSSLSEVSIALG